MATIIKKVKILLDEHQEPFIPFVTTDAVFKNGTDEKLTDFLDNYIEQKDTQVNEFLEEADTHVTETINQANEDVAELIRQSGADVDAIIADLEYKRDHGYFTGPRGPQGIQGIQGETGNSGVHYGHTAPTDPEVKIWIDTTDPIAVERAEDNEY